MELLSWPLLMLCFVFSVGLRLKIPFLLWAIHNGTKFRIVIGSFEQNLAKTISVYVHKSNDLRWLPKVIFLKNFVTAEACNSSDNQKTKTATWRSQQLSAWISYPNLFFLRPKSSIHVFFLGFSLKYLTFFLGLCQFRFRKTGRLCKRVRIVLQNWFHFVVLWIILK